MTARPEPARREDPAVRSRRVVALALGFVSFAILLSAGLAIYYRWITGADRGAAVEDFPAPRLQPNPAQDWADVHAAQVRALDGYGWVDRSKGLVHVPIDRAMAVVVARGTKAYDPAEGTEPFRPPAGAPLDGAPRAEPQPAVAPYGTMH